MKIAKGLWRPFQGNFGHVSWEKTFVESIRTDLYRIYKQNIDRITRNIDFVFTQH